MAHTPGPWTVDEPWQVWAESIGEYVALTQVENFETVSPDQVVANAVLISAAPDLLSSLIALMERYMGLVASGDCGNWDPEKEDGVIAVRAAIAKATGTK